MHGLRSSVNKSVSAHEPREGTMKGPVRKAYEIVRPYDDGSYSVWDNANTLQEAGEGA